MVGDVEMGELTAQQKMLYALLLAKTQTDRLNWRKVSQTPLSRMIDSTVGLRGSFVTNFKGYTARIQPPNSDSTLIGIFKDGECLTVFSVPGSSLYDLISGAATVSLENAIKRLDRL